MTTMRDVALRAGVSIKTVSRVVNDDGYISDGVRQRVQQAIEQTNYTPNLLAKSFRLGRDSAIGIAVPDLADPFFGTIARAVEREARLRDTVALVTGLGETPEEERTALEAMLRRQVSGLILASISHDHRYLASWAAQIPMVFVDRPPQNLQADSVTEDDAKGAAEAVTSLIAMGHRRIALLAPAGTVVTLERRRAGYYATLAKFQIPADPELEGYWHGESMPAMVDAMLALPSPPTAVFAANSTTTRELVPHLHRIKRTDLALVGFGDIPMSDSLQPSVSVVDQRPDDLGRIAVERLFRRITEPGKRLKRHQLLAVSVVERDSSRIPGPYLGRVDQPS
ncbi:MAG: LacI family DNA-binding transcriptional regulator [Mycobacterium sp.]